MKRIEISREEVADLLETTNLKNELTLTDISKIAPYLDAWSASEGETIFKEGDFDPYMFILAEGKVNVVKVDTSGMRKVLTTIKRRSSVGEMALLDGQPRSADIVAAEDCIFLTLSKDTLEILMDKMPRTALRIVLFLGRTVSLRLRQTSGLLAERDYLMF